MGNKPPGGPAFEEVEKKLTSGTPVGDEGTVQAAANTMSTEGATETARTIVSLYDQVSARHRDFRDS